MACSAQMHVWYSIPLSSNRQHYEIDDCLKENTLIIRTAIFDTYAQL